MNPCLLVVAGGQASRDYIASFFHALATAGAESTEGFGEMADEAATPGGLNEQVHRALQGNGGYELVADQLDAIFKRLGNGPGPAPRAQLNDDVSSSAGFVFVADTTCSVRSKTNEMLLLR